MDGIRCLAVVLVVLFHAHGFFTNGSEPTTVPELAAAGPVEAVKHLPHSLIAKGWFGVQIFFVISGLVLALPFAAHYLKGDPRPQPRVYFKRRFIRIEIPYLIALTFFFLFEVLFNNVRFSDQLPHYGAGLIYAHMFFFDGVMNPVLFVSWTLELEVQFYLAIPLLCRVFALSTIPRRLALIAGIMAVSYCSRVPSEGLAFFILHRTFVGQLGWFLSGLLLADLYLSPQLQKIRARGGLLAADVIGFLVWPLVFVLIDSDSPLPIRPFVLALAFWTVLAGRVLRGIFSNRWITATGMMCYTIYLFHIFVMHGYVKPWLFGPIIPITGGNWPWNGVLQLLMALITIVVCGFIYLVVEKPFARGTLSWRRKDKEPALSEPLRSE